MIVQVQKQITLDSTKIFGIISLPEIVKFVVELFGVFLRQPLLTECSRLLLTVTVLPAIIITWNYEFYLISFVTAPKTFQPFKSLKEMMANDYTIHYLRYGHDQKQHYHRLSLINEFKIQGIKLDDAKTFFEINSTWAWHGLSLLSKSRPKMSVLINVQSSVSLVLVHVKTEVHKGKYDCYALRGAALFKLRMDYAQMKIFEKILQTNHQYSETGFREVWMKWATFRSNLKKKQFEIFNKVHNEYLSFENLLSFFKIYGFLLSLNVCLMGFEMVGLLKIKLIKNTTGNTVVVLSTRKIMVQKV